MTTSASPVTVPGGSSYAVAEGKIELSATTTHPHDAAVELIGPA